MYILPKRFKRRTIVFLILSSADDRIRNSSFLKTFWQYIHCTCSSAKPSQDKDKELPKCSVLRKKH